MKLSLVIGIICMTVSQFALAGDCQYELAFSEEAARPAAFNIINLVNKTKAEPKYSHPLYAIFIQFDSTFGFTGTELNDYENLSSFRLIRHCRISDKPKNEWGFFDYRDADACILYEMFAEATKLKQDLALGSAFNLSVWDPPDSWKSNIHSTSVDSHVLPKEMQTLRRQEEKSVGEFLLTALGLTSETD